MNYKLIVLPIALIAAGGVAATQKSASKKPMLLDANQNLVDKISDGLFAHVHADGTCRLVYAKYDHQVGLRTTDRVESQGVPGHRIVLHRRIGSDRLSDFECNGNDTCAKSEEVYGGGCHQSCVYATIDGVRNTPEACWNP